MDHVQGTSGAPLTPQEAQAYRKEYKEGADLFEKTLHRYETSDNKYQQHEFLEVMHKASQVLNDASRALKNKELQAKSLKLQQDLDAFEKQPDADHAEKLRQDLKNLS